MMTLLCIVVLLVLVCISLGQPRPHAPGPPCRNTPDNAAVWIGIGLLALVGYIVLEKKETQESTLPVKAGPEPAVQPMTEKSQAAAQPLAPPMPPTPPWMRPPPGVTPPVPPHPLGRNPFEPP
jgi:hypothetical protein